MDWTLPEASFPEVARVPQTRTATAPRERTSPEGWWRDWPEPGYDTNSGWCVPTTQDGGDARVSTTAGQRRGVTGRSVPGIYVCEGIHLGWRRVQSGSNQQRVARWKLQKWFSRCSRVCISLRCMLRSPVPSRSVRLRPWHTHHIGTIRSDHSRASNPLPMLYNTSFCPPLLWLSFLQRWYIFDTFEHRCCRSRWALQRWP